jgi:hypothetical protein
MEAVPGLTDLPAKLLSQCGIVTAVLVIGIVWLALQLAKTRASWETDRAGMMKMFQEQNAAFDKIAISHAKLEGMLFALQTRSSGDDD